MQRQGRQASAPGRPKTDVLDAVWLCKIAERQMIRPSFVPPPPIRRLRDLTRYRAALLLDRLGAFLERFSSSSSGRQGRR